MTTHQKPMVSARRAALLLAAAILPGLALGHGNAPHAGKAGPVKLEQTDWGIAGTARKGQRVIDIRMTDDMRFKPDQLTFRLGETVRLRVHNNGAVLHEFVLGTKPELDAHALQMIKFPNMEHDAPYMAHVAPGKSGEIVWTFNRAGSFDFACLIAGHYQAGMVGKVTVLPAAARAAAASPQAPSTHRGPTP